MTPGTSGRMQGDQPRPCGAGGGPGPTQLSGVSVSTGGTAPPGGSRPHSHSRGEPGRHRAPRVRPVHVWRRRAKRRRCVFRLVSSVLTIVSRQPGRVTGPHVPEPGEDWRTHTVATSRRRAGVRLPPGAGATEAPCPGPHHGLAPGPAEVAAAPREPGRRAGCRGLRGGRRGPLKEEAAQTETPDPRRAPIGGLCSVDPPPGPVPGEGASAPGGRRLCGPVSVSSLVRKRAACPRLPVPCRC